MARIPSSRSVLVASLLGVFFGLTGGVAQAATISPSTYQGALGDNEHLALTVGLNWRGYAIWGVENAPVTQTFEGDCKSTEVSAPGGAGFICDPQSLPTLTEVGFPYPGKYTINLGPGNEVAEASASKAGLIDKECTASTCPFEFIENGEGGNDQLSASLEYGGMIVLNGGEGDDELFNDASPGTRAILEGGPGDDTIQGSPNSIDTITCGPGNDTVWNAGPEDTVSSDCEKVNGREVSVSEPEPESAPVAECDAYWVKPNQVLSVGPTEGVLLNDGDPEGLPLISKVRSTSFGASSHPYSLGADGSLLFRATKAGAAKLTYVAVDSAGRQSQPAEIIIYIQDKKPSAAQLHPCPKASFNRSINVHPIHPYEWLYGKGGDDLNHGKATDIVLRSSREIDARHCSINQNEAGGTFHIENEVHIGGLHKGMVYIKSISYTIAVGSSGVADADYSHYIIWSRHGGSYSGSELTGDEGLGGDFVFEGPSKKFPKPGKLTLTLNRWYPTSHNHGANATSVEMFFGMGLDVDAPDHGEVGHVPAEIDTPLGALEGAVPPTCDFDDVISFDDDYPASIKPESGEGISVLPLRIPLGPLPAKK